MGAFAGGLALAGVLARALDRDPQEHTALDLATGLATTQILAPRFGRLLTWTLGGAGLNDFPTAAFDALTHKSNELESRVGRADAAQPRSPRSRASASLTSEPIRPHRVQT